MNLLTKMFSRPFQVGSAILLGFSLHILLPHDPEAIEWAAYGACFLAYLVNGMDNYREGLERGIEICEILKDKP